MAHKATLAPSEIDLYIDDTKIEGFAGEAQVFASRKGDDYSIQTGLMRSERTRSVAAHRDGTITFTLRNHSKSNILLHKCSLDLKYSGRCRIVCRATEREHAAATIERVTHHVKPDQTVEWLLDVWGLMLDPTAAIAVEVDKGPDGDSAPAIVDLPSNH